MAESNVMTWKGPETLRAPKHAATLGEAGELRMPKHAAVKEEADGSFLPAHAARLEPEIAPSPTIENVQQEGSDALSAAAGLGASEEADELSAQMESTMFEGARSFSMPEDGYLSVNSRRTLTAVSLCAMFSTACFLAWWAFG